MNEKHLIILGTAVFLAISGVGVGGAQAATNIRYDTYTPGIGIGLPLSPVSQQNAMRAAEDYLEVEAFSRQGLIKQLEYDNFSAEDATYAVDSITVDWNAQAAKRAKEYLSIKGFSHEGLINQLEYDGFTPAQAEYGVAAAGL